MRAFCCSILVGFLLGGCSLWSEPPPAPAALIATPAVVTPEGSGLVYRDTPIRRPLVQGAPASVFIPAQQYSYQPAYTHKDLSEYAEQLAMSLEHSLHQQDAGKLRVGVASFVHFDHSLQHSDILGNQLAELLIVELQHLGFQVVDFRNTGQLQVNWSGDYVFSRDAAELAQAQQLGYVLSGTMLSKNNGVKVNARMLNMQNNGVVASAKVLIPSFVVQDLQPLLIMQ